MFVMIVPMLASCSPKAENSIDENTVAKAEDESPSSESAPFYRSKVAYAAEDGLYCTSMDDGKATLLVKGTGISNPKFSGDGNTVAFMQGGALHAYDFATSQARILLEGVDSYCPGKKGEFYASLQKTGIVAVNPQTAESSTIVPAGEDIS